MRSFPRLLGVLVLAIPLAGCHQVRFRTRLPAGDEIHEKTLSYWAFGLIGQHEVDLDALCPSGVAAWRAEAVSWADIITLGIYTPRKVVVECAGVKR